MKEVFGRGTEMETKIKYLPYNWTLYENTGKNPVSRSVSGYGSKLPTRFLAFDGIRLRRVYAICWSNCASFYVRVKGQRVFIQDSRFSLSTFDGEIPLPKIYKNFRG